VFLSDRSEDSETVSAILSNSGYAVVEVDPQDLRSRCLAQQPSAIVVDIDAAGAVDELHALHAHKTGDTVQSIVLCIGSEAGANADAALSVGASGFFAKPLDLGALVRTIDALTGALRSNRRAGDHGSVSPPPAITAARPQTLQLPPFGVPPAPRSSRAVVDAPRELQTATSSIVNLSPDVRDLLAQAEQRAGMAACLEVAALTPEQELEAVLSADVLAALDEPLEHSPASREISSAPMHQQSMHDATIKLEGGELADNQLGRVSPLPIDDLPSPARAPTQEMHSTHVTSEWPKPISSDQVAFRDVPSSAPSTAPAGPGLADPVEQLEPVERVCLVRSEADARHTLARAIARRQSGSLHFASQGVSRRIVLREGDFTSATSTLENETLEAFLVARGDLPRSALAKRSGRIAPDSRHAGAALVAQGWLAHDRLWDTLRAHAEWIILAALRSTHATVTIEREPLTGQRTEPGVFGPATGAEVLVELVRRSVSPEEAIACLGNERSLIVDGANAHLYAECKLQPPDHELVESSRERSVAHVLAFAPEREIACILHALVLLGVLDILPAAESHDGDNHAHDHISTRDQALFEQALAIDAHAVRTRVTTRSALVDEGDYFAILGVSPEATSYEIRRAFTELRRSFDPSRILSAATLDLADDVAKIIAVIEEAYEILREPARRERYKRAIFPPKT